MQNNVLEEKNALEFSRISHIKLCGQEESQDLTLSAEQIDFSFNRERHTFDGYLFEGIRYCGPLEFT